MISKKWAGLVAGVGALALLSGCAGTDDPTPTDPEAPVTTEAAPPADPAPSEEPGNAPDQNPGAGAVDIEAGFAAVELATTEITGGQVIALDWDDDGHWTVDLISGDTEHEVKTNAEGTEILEQEQDSVDREDAERLTEVQVSLEDAVRTAMGEAEGDFDAVDLDTQGGAVVWEVEIDTPDGNDVSVYVDVATGEVLNRG